MEICDLQNVERRAGTSPKNTLRCLWSDWKNSTNVHVSRSCFAVVQDLPSSCSVSRNKIPLKASGLCHTAQVPRGLGDHRRRRKVLDRYGYLQGAEAWRQQPAFAVSASSLAGSLGSLGLASLQNQRQGLHCFRSIVAARCAQPPRTLSEQACISQCIFATCSTAARDYHRFFTTRRQGGTLHLRLAV